MKLHITNGDCAGEMLKASASIEGEVLCWRDLLHDGPVLALPYPEYTAKRVEYLMALLRDGGMPELSSAEQITDDFVKRDQVLSNLNAYDEVVLWFEHDLYDQLQLIEVCHRINEKMTPLPKLSIVSIDTHPEVPFFHGFGNLTVAMMEGLYTERKDFTQGELQKGCELWRCLVSESPMKLAEIVKEEIEGWPYMVKALNRFCHEFPDINTGLTLTQTYLLLALLKAPDELPFLEYNLKRAEENGVLAKGESAQQRYYEILTGPATFKRIFNHLQALEDAPFMGDLSVRYELNRLLKAKTPYITMKKQEGTDVYSLTHAGAEALLGRRQWHRDNCIDTWRGAVHITTDTLWVWDSEKGTFLCHSTS